MPGYDWAVDGSTIGQWNVTSGYAGGTLVDQAGADNNGTGGAGLTSFSFP